MSTNPKPTARQVNPIVQAAADQVAKGKRGPRKNLHEPCRGQLSLFDPKEGNRS
ncbi:hypothetical protein ACFYT3_05270 [Nocardia amikacinitolerans]|uniref:hypothetical protein n=1 Tax=Nocardia amikacinitolerans TaxID=756689 RepID=UPI00369AD817